MGLNFSPIFEAYGCDYSDLSKNKNVRKNKSLEEEKIEENNKELNEMYEGYEGFANYQGENSMAQIISEESFVKKNKKSKKNKKINKINKNRAPPVAPRPPTPKPVLVEDSSSDEESDTETVPEQKVSNETLELRKQMNELDTKLNLLINNLNSETSNKETRNNKETNNIYDIILFVIFGLFVLLLLESLTKLISKNIVKYEPSNSIKAIME